MPTWTEIRADFQALENNQQYFRLDYQWGVAGVYYQVAGAPPTPVTRRFEILSEMAGRLLSEIPDDQLDPNVSKVPPGKERWYEALRYHSGEFQHHQSGTQHDTAGNDMGRIHTGSIHLPVHASANFALRLSMVEPRRTQTADESGSLGRLNAFLRREASKRGYLWLVIGFVITLIVGALAI